MFRFSQSSVGLKLKFKTIFPFQQTKTEQIIYILGENELFITLFNEIPNFPEFLIKAKINKKKRLAQKFVKIRNLDLKPSGEKLKEEEFLKTKQK